jgi:hypothetical protein
MSAFKLLGALAVLSSLSATPISAQAVVQEPGYCAQFYPNANCQNKGPGNPYGNYPQPTAQRNDWSSGQTVGVAPRRSRPHRSGWRTGGSRINPDALMQRRIDRRELGSQTGAEPVHD